MVMAFVQGAFGKNVLVTFGLSTYVMLGLRVVYFNCSEPFFGVDIICALEPEPASLIPLTFSYFSARWPFGTSLGSLRANLPGTKNFWTLYLQPCKLFLKNTIFLNREHPKKHAWTMWPRLEHGGRHLSGQQLFLLFWYSCLYGTNSQKR